MNKQNKMVAITLSVLSIFVLIGIGMAYFSAPVSNVNKEKYSLETATISLKFDDGDNGISGTLNLGESVTKKFTLENTGTKDAYARINWVDLVNTYTANSLSWQLEQSTSENGTYSVISRGDVPSSSTASTVPLVRGVTVPVNTTYYYKLTITLNNLDLNQNSDINANLNSKFNIVEDTNIPGTTTIRNLVQGSPTNTTDVITKAAPIGASCTNTLAYDGTTDNNLRYVGANPCNYVTFNEEEAGWRIVGLMNNVDDGTGKTETRIKLVRATSLGSYSWDTSDSSINSGRGINDWTQADLKNELNGDYLNTNLQSNTNWYNDRNNIKTGVYDYTKGLKSSAQSQIGDTKWYLGGMDSYTDSDLYPYKMYTFLERGTKVWGSTVDQICNDGYCPRSLDWTGKVALIYPSDYGLATAGGNTMSRYGCVTNLSTSDNGGSTWGSFSDCSAGDWISNQWMLSPDSYKSNAMYVSSLGTYGRSTDSDNPVHPVIYLKSDVTITGGNGSQENPYILS